MLARIILLFVLTLVALQTIIAQHYSNLTLFCNNTENDIHFKNCDLLEDLIFNAGYNYVIESGGKFTWQLYRNGILINEKVQVINYKSGCITIPELPNYSFQTSSISGTYELTLFYENYSFIGVGCSGVYLNNPSNSNDLILYSNKIKVTRFDDESECKCEQNPETINADCFQLNIIHNGGSLGFINIPPQDVKLRARQILISNCDIAPNGYNVSFIAGNTVSLKQGFKSGNNFRAYLDNCDDGIIVQRTEKYEETEDTINLYSNKNKLITVEKFNNLTNCIIYPNPTNGIITIEIPEIAENTTLQIYNAYGQLMLQQQIKPTQTQVDLSPFGKGLYVVQIRDALNNISTNKIVLQ
ncbi:MAG: hypothetical protein KatS3mg027_1868 [Bacteroidia bacterium]|nr:MAG: hypothetical protein KatS3mg027_1868 [Bacteroidia bacterium]